MSLELRGDFVIDIKVEEYLMWRNLLRADYRRTFPVTERKPKTALPYWQVARGE